jgi:hypothetical protein
MAVFGITKLDYVSQISFATRDLSVRNPNAIALAVGQTRYASLVRGLPGAQQRGTGSFWTVRAEPSVKIGEMRLSRSSETCSPARHFGWIDCFWRILPLKTGWISAD